MITLIQISLFFSPLQILPNDLCKKPISCPSLPSSKIASFSPKRFKMRAYREKWSGILVKYERRKRRRRVVLMRFNGGGGGGKDTSGTTRLLGNVALAIGLTYLSMTGQLGWVFDAIGWVLDVLISIWLLAVLIPIVGLGAFLWWTGRDILQGTWWEMSLCKIL